MSPCKLVSVSVVASVRVVDIHALNAHSETTTTTTTTGVSPKRAHCFVASPFLMDPSEQPISGAAQRRRQRRLRSMLRHERMFVAMALAEKLHHSSRGQRMARAGEEECDMKHTAKFRTTPPPQPVLFSLYEEEPGGGRPEAFVEPRPQERVQRHTVEHITDLVRVAPMVQILDAPVPQTGGTAAGHPVFLQCAHA